ncbi:MAG: hypothetical protein AAF601_13755 [Pseudomonadota bacterium]
MGLAQAISEAPENLLDDLATYVMTECTQLGDDSAAEDALDTSEVVSALKAWAYMNMNAPGVD